MSTRRAIAAIAAIAMGALLVGCAQSIASASYQGGPPGNQPIVVDADGVLVSDPVAWMVDGHTLGLAVQSGSCVPTPTDIVAADEQSLTIQLERGTGWFCTTSSGWHTFEFALEGVLADFDPRTVDVRWPDDESVSIPVR